MKVKNVLILGSEGYVGCMLSQHLSHKFNVSKVDICWFGNYQETVTIKDISKITAKDLEFIDAVVLLAGHSSTKMCVGDWNSTFSNNVRNFVSLMKIIKENKRKIKFIFASSSSVYGNTFGKIASEDQTQKPALNEYDASKIMLEQAATQEKEIEWYGLRFGTVNGFSPNFRTELMINSMYTSAIKNSVIAVTNPNINRSILGINDLCRSIECILVNGDQTTKGFYNISSFNSSVDEISKSVSDMTSCQIIHNEDLPNPYDFMTTNCKFESTFDFKFTDSLSSIVNGLKDNFNRIVKMGDRNTNVTYWS